MAGEMVQQSRALAISAEDPNSVSSIYMAGNNCLLLQFQWIRCPLLTSLSTAGRSAQTLVHIKNILRTCLKIIILFKTQVGLET